MKVKLYACFMLFMFSVLMPSGVFASVLPGTPVASDPVVRKTSPEGYSGKCTTRKEGVGTSDDGEKNTLPGKKVISKARHKRTVTNTEDVSRIWYSVASPANICILLYDVKGKLIHEVWDRRQNAGCYLLTINMDNLSRGTYVITVTRNGEMKQSIEFRKY